MKKGELYIKTVLDTSEIDELTIKTEKLVRLLNEAMELACSIANTELSVRISTESYDQTTELASITTE